MSLYSQLDRLASDLESVKKQLHAVANTNQLQRSSVEAGSLDFNDEDGNLKAIIGLQHDGATAVNVVNGPKPPTPAGITADVDNGRIILRWDGTFAGDIIAPTDWARTEIYAQEGGFVVPTSDNARGSFVSAAGGELTIGVTRGTWTVCMAAWSQAGRQSDMSAPITVEVPGFGDIVLEKIDAAQTKIENAKSMLFEGTTTLEQKLADMGDMEGIEEDIAQAREEAIQAAMDAIENVKNELVTSINGKTTTTWSTSNPPASYTGTVGDLWVKMSSLGSGGRETARSRWNGSAWVSATIDGVVLSNVDASTITTGFLDVANRIRSGSIFADKLLIGGGSNLLPAPDFSTGWGSLLSVVPGEGKDGSNLVRISASTSTTGGYSGRTSGLDPLHSKVTGGSFYRVSAWVRSDIEIPPNSASLYVRAFTAQDGIDNTFSWADPTTLGNRDTIPANTWSLVSGIVEMPEGAIEASLGLYVRYTFNHAMEYCLPSIQSATDGTLITPGGVQTPHLAADVLEVGNLKAGTAAIAEAVISKLWAEVVVAKMVTATEFIGENAILTGAITAPKITASEELTAKIAEFLRVRAEMIEADAIDGMVITAPTIQSAKSGRRWVASTDSIRVINGDNDVRTQLSPEGSTFKGEVEADTLVVNEGAEFKGSSTLAQGANLTLAAGVTDPTAPPVVQPFWDGLEFTPPSNATPVGLAFDGTHYWAAEAWPEAGKAWKINADTGDAELVWLPVAWGRMLGVTCIGSELYWLTLLNYTSKVIVTDLNLGKKREFEYREIGFSSTDRLVYKPGIGNDGTNIVIAQCDDLGSLRWRTYNKTTGAQIGSEVNRNDATKSDITGVYVGSGDFGATRVVVAKKSTNTIQVFTTTGAATTYSWHTAESNEQGVVYVDGKFRSLSPGGVVNEYADRNTGDGADDWWGTYRWSIDADKDGYNDYTTRIGPSVQFTWPKRAKLKFLGAPLPVGTGYIAPSVAKKATKPVRTDFRTPNWSVRVGEAVAWYDSFPTNWQSGSAPSDSNDFPTATPSTLKSANSQFEVNGDGTGRWGPITWHSDGTVTGPESSGQTVITPSSSGTVTSVEVTFPAGRFKRAPEVSLTPYTGSPHQVSVGAWPVSKDSFTLNVYSSTTAARRVSWQATDSQET